SERYVWHRKGFAAKALPDERNAAMLAARKLNNQADRGLIPRKSAERLDNQTRLSWYCDHWQQSDAFKQKAAQTKLNYRSQLHLIQTTLPTQKITAFKKRHIKRFLETIESVGMRRICRVVLRQVFELALDDELIDRNPADNIMLPGIKGRKQLWKDAQID